ncbi:DUF1990 family protein [uncultured Jatrophihabitans sp.]|uniref:DUF1990 family protein n=1 Tax=uncultured Jatrophihabitans sp. TaxID=1610747 RepID=UPI0035CAB0F8
MTAVRLLDAATVERLRAQSLTYPEVGRVFGELPTGYRHLRRTRRLPEGTGFDEASRALLQWQVQARSGLRVAASSIEVEQDAVVVLSVGVGPLALTIPCRVVAVVDASNRRGFAYGTLPGHPERGEEAFVLERHDDGSVDFTITAFSRPATRLARLGGPIGTGVQDLVTRRYLRALDG